ncbi:lipopolysaccharide kinase InaA family protein [Endozoicomonas euniceicola]|uniref:Non-specific serine/threonine protein kinase n=1 Tax=Endozoicomonas euniceicola TaxID=1234143 RepID=A0ABY6GYS5_9GAMM|nr:lipopolysaccharide kinase InaA family protein [Endozoicomonas euniceicola]UYM17977.1 hypothetical protein NX720_08760 [Endozoicomonas euniceicola]
MSHEVKELIKDINANKAIELTTKTLKSNKDIARDLAGFTPKHDSVFAIELKSLKFNSKKILHYIQKIRKANEPNFPLSSYPCSDFKKEWKKLEVKKKQKQCCHLDKLLGNPDLYIQLGKKLKDDIATTAAIVEVNISNNKKKFFIKRYNSKGHLYSIVRSIIPSRAENAWHAANILKYYGIATPEPLALIEDRIGPIKKSSYIVHEYIESVHAMNFFAEGSLPNSKWQPAADDVEKILYTLQRALLSHGDLKGQNFIITSDQVMLVDLDSFRSHTHNFFYSRLNKKDLNRFEKNWMNEDYAKSLFKPILNKLRSNLKY